MLKSSVGWNIFENSPYAKQEAGLNMFYRICIIKITCSDHNAINLEIDF